MKKTVTLIGLAAMALARAEVWQKKDDVAPRRPCVQCGCDGKVDEAISKLFSCAMNDYEAGRFYAAIAGFEYVLKKAPLHPLAHLRLGMLLQDVRKDYLGAIVHFRLYLDLCPSEDKTAKVTDRIEECKNNMFKVRQAHLFEKELDRLRAENSMLRDLLRFWKAKCEIPDFESTVRIPRDALNNESDTADELTRDDYRLARIDAWVLTHSIFSDLKKGFITREEAIKEISDLAKRAARDEDVFSAARFEFYDSVGDATALARLLAGAVSILQESKSQTEEPHRRKMIPTDIELLKDEDGAKMSTIPPTRTVKPEQTIKLP